MNKNTKITLKAVIITLLIMSVAALFLYAIFVYNLITEVIIGLFAFAAISTVFCAIFDLVYEYYYGKKQ